MKRFLCLVLAAALLLCFAACNNSDEPQSHETEASTQENPTPVEGQKYDYDEYSDHIVLTAYKGSETYVTLPAKIHNKPVTSFGTIFRSNLTLISITIPSDSSYTAIEENAFSECYNLTTLVIGDRNTSLISIGSNAFYGCQALKTARIPATVTDIADDAFKYCTDLVIYGAEGSAIEKFASNFNSIYFRVKEQATTTAAPTTAPTTAVQEQSTEQTTAAESTSN